ncbi:DUF3618 domain-containing protein [Planosporangium sp. 12N6]|uniref:DUF3618 domain-containing protein n=1 Tax=Planosporangium spinosum TaxID=3402278 RepID=UPI003CF25ECC
MTTTPGASDGAALSRNEPGSSSAPVSRGEPGSSSRPLAETRTELSRPARPPADVDELRADIEHTRAELGETVQALAAKVDVKARFQEGADEAKARLREGLVEAPERAQELAARTGQAVRRNPVPYAVAAGAVVLIVVFLRWRNSRTVVADQWTERADRWSRGTW